MSAIVQRIKVKEVRYLNKETNYAVFTACKMKAARGGLWKTTKEIMHYVGFFMSVCPNDQFVVTCTPKEHKFYGKQMEIIVHQRQQPGTIEELQLFLMSHIHGMGEKRAKQVTDRYGLDTISAIRNDPHALDFVNIGEEKRKRIREEIIENSNFEELLALLMLYGIDHRYANVVYGRYGVNAVEQLKTNPYAVYQDKIFDFITAEKIAFQQGVSFDSRNRVYSLMMACLTEDSVNNGNLYMNWSDLAMKCNAMLVRKNSPYKMQYLPQECLDDAVKRALSGNRLFIDYTDERKPIYLMENYWDESGIIKGVQRIKNGLKRHVYVESAILTHLKYYQSKYNIRLAKQQEAAVKTALTSPISIITGGPGTGKTQTINTLLAAIRTLSPTASIRLAAPTGKAAVRITQVTNMKASTIHKMLGIFSKTQELNVELNCDFLIIDEFSMVDAHLFNRILHKTAEHTRLILIGDYHQLPSVGPGLVLRDLISSGVIPTVILNEIFRQAETSSIVKNATALITDRTQDISFSSTKDGDFYFLEADSTTKTVELILRAIENMQKNRGFSLNDIQVLSPLHSGDVGVDNLNTLFQQKFNQNGEALEYKDKEFRVGDRVIHIQNNYDLGVVNGEIGTVIAVGNSTTELLQVEYPDHDTPVWYSYGDLAELELAYAVTVHKSQGSEFPVIILPINRTLLSGLNMNLIYTAWTRAKKAVVMVGDKKLLYQALQKSVIDERNSKLSIRLLAG